MKHKKGYLVKTPTGLEYWHRTLGGAGERVEQSEGWWAKHSKSCSQVISCETGEDITSKVWKMIMLKYRR